MSRTQLSAALLALTGILCVSTSANAQTASGKFTCDGETYKIESAVAAWVPEKKDFKVWAFAGKFTDDELKAFAFIESGVRPKAHADKAFHKAGMDMLSKTQPIKYVKVEGRLKDAAQKVERSNLQGGGLLYVKCLTNVNLNFNVRPGDKDPKYDIAKAFKSFDFPLKDGAKVKYQTSAFTHNADPKGIKTKTTWEYKVDTKVYVIE